MAHRLLIIEEGSTPADASARALLADDTSVHCTAISWQQMVDKTESWPACDAVVAVAVPLPGPVERMFQRLSEQTSGTPTFAVLPSDLGEPLLHLAAESVDDFMLSPLRPVELRQRLSRLLGPLRAEAEVVREMLLEEMGRAQLVGQDPVFLRTVEQIPRFARSGMPALITGETGTGKELCARAIHFFGPRRDFPFIAVDCGALPDQLIENELFGHARGAYTDAHRDQRGLVAMAEGGTLFLDEIDALSLPAQGKLLRFLQERTFRPLGSDCVRRADVNVITATNRNLEVLVRDKHFRPDLFYRLNVLQLHLPPLRERRGDIGMLAAHCLDQVDRRGGLPRKRLSAAALRGLEARDWPGNVRELFNVVQRAAVACDGAQILPCHVALLGPAPTPGGAPRAFRAARAAAVETFEKLYVEELLGKHRGNVTRAARDAEKDRRAFGRLVKKYGIDRRTL